MSDDGRAKRQKSSGDGAVIISKRERITELESEIAQLRRRVVQQLEGNHEVLPVVVTATVDLSRVDTSIVTHISSFLDTSRELLNMALTCKSFGWRKPMSTLNTSLVEEVARQAVCSRATGAEMSRLPQCVSGTMTWLSILHKFENLSSFDILLGEGVEYLNGDKATVHNTGSKICSAVSSIYNMRIGSHFAEFEIIDANSGMPFIGIVRPMPGLNSRVFFEEDHYFIGNSNAYPDFLEQRSDEWGVGGVHACEYFCGTGGMSWTSWVEDEDEEEQTLLAWQGREACLPGDTIGMHLNLDEGTLTVYKNNRRLGVMKDGLSGSYFWYVSVWGGAAISIKRGEPPRA